MNTFWIQNPAILFEKDKIGELFPSDDMCFESKLNAICRLVILLSIVGFITSGSIKIILIGALTLFSISVIYFYKKKEGFQGQQQKIELDSNNLETFLETEFKEGNYKNPFSNLLLTEIADDPERKSAPPSFNPTVDEDIIKNTKKMIQHLNPGIKNTDKQLFSSLTDNFDLDQSMRPFYSTPNTKVANDMNAFAKWLYHDFKFSSKESTAEGAMARTADAYRYTLR